MGTKREVLGLVVRVESFRKNGNGAKGGGRKGNSGKRAKLFKLDEKGGRELVAVAEEATAYAATKELRAKTNLIPPHVAINSHGETHF